MVEFFHSVLIVLCLVAFLFLLLFLGYSIAEKEKLATRRIVLLLFVFCAFFITILFFTVSWQIESVFVVLFFLMLVVFIVPFGNKKVLFENPRQKFDERDIMFSRMELVPESQRFNDYYKMRPHNKPKDDNFRKQPGLLSPKSKQFSSLLFTAADSTFTAVDSLQSLVNGKPAEKITYQNQPKELETFIKNWAIKMGAHSVGFTLLKEYHKYSIVGRGKDYGKPVELNHKYAIAFTVEMAHEFVQPAPKGSIIMESSQQYFNAGQIAVQIADFLRKNGYEARAHIDANYRVICPSVAQDAGLGTIGRMGLLMTPKLGPRVRIGVVTTNLPLTPNKKPIDSSVIQFCNLCKKCAVNCPSQAIHHNTISILKLIKPWKINHEKCFTYWSIAGTDCGKCIAVCPYSHPNNLIHNIVRAFIKQNQFNRWLALRFDNYFYGVKPKSKPLPEWTIK